MDIINWVVLISEGLAIVAIVVLAIIGGWHLYSKGGLLKTADASKHIGKPEIIVFLRPHISSVQCLMLCIENLGTETAYNIQFETAVSRNAPFVTPTSDLSGAKLLKKNNFFHRGIKCFGPGQKIEQFLISLRDKLPEELKQPLQISLTYTDSRNHNYEHRYTLDFGEFESLGNIDSMEVNIISDLKPLFDMMQKGFGEIAESIRHLRLSQTSNPSSKTKPEEAEEFPDIQKIVTLYNGGEEAELRKIYEPHYSIRVTNQAELYQNPNITPLFQTQENGSFVAYAIDLENLYAVVPFFGCILQNDLYNSGAFSKVFECPGFDPKCQYHVKVVRPAFFKRDPVNEKWTLEEKGKLELKERNN